MTRRFSSADDSPRGRDGTRPAGSLSDSLLPVVRRLLQTGTGPAALVSWVRASGADLTPRAIWTGEQETAARDLAGRAAGWLGGNGLRATLARSTGETVGDLGT
jgi:hypothetical protein